MKQYKTTDYSLAAWLLTQGAVFAWIEKTKNETKVNFLLNISDSIDFSRLMEIWHSPASDIYREIIRKAKLLKAELHNHYSK